MARPAPTLPVQLGSIVGEKYRLERLIGAGGMGAVALATHLDLGQRVALKFLLETRRGDEEATARFIREARAAAALSSDHVARVLDTGTLDSGEPFIVLEYLEGTNLDERLEKEGSLSPEETVTIFLQACDALAEAHTRGIVHRDIKPTNIFLAKRPNGRSTVKILDFGISKLTDPALLYGGASDLTGSETILGTPHYMAPEQMTSTKDAEAPADVWALGVCMYKCLSGRLPFEKAMTLMELGAFVLSQDVPPILSVAPNTPAPLASIIMRCLTRDPSRRFKDAGELMEVLAGTSLAKASTTGSNPMRVATPPKAMEILLDSSDTDPTVASLPVAPPPIQRAAPAFPFPVPPPAQATTTSASLRPYLYGALVAVVLATTIFAVKMAQQDDKPIIKAPVTIESVQNTTVPSTTPTAGVATTIPSTTLAVVPSGSIKPSTSSSSNSATKSVKPRPTGHPRSDPTSAPDQR